MCGKENDFGIFPLLNFTEHKKNRMELKFNEMPFLLSLQFACRSNHFC